VEGRVYVDIEEHFQIDVERNDFEDVDGYVMQM
jgi:hypothetical protein